MNKPITATEDDPRWSERLSPAELDLASFVAYSYSEYSWAQQYLRDFTPEEREESRREGKRFMSDPAVQRLLAEKAERKVAAQS